MKKDYQNMLKNLIKDAILVNKKIKKFINKIQKSANLVGVIIE